MRAFVLLALVALASATSSAYESMYDECPVAPANPGDRRKGYQRTFVLAVQRTFPNAKQGDGDVVDQAQARTRVDRIATELTALDADFVHLSGVDGCAELTRLVAASTAIDASVAGDYRPYLVAGKGVGSGGDSGSDSETQVASPSLLTRLDPTSDLYLAHKTGPTELPPHYFARIKIGGVNVLVAGIDAKRDDTDTDENEKIKAQNAWSTEIKNRLDRGDQVIVLGEPGEFLSSINNTLTKLPATSKVWVSFGIQNALLTYTSESRLPRVVKRRSEFFTLTITFKPGVFTNEEETLQEYFTNYRVYVIACEFLFACVFVRGVVRLAFPQSISPSDAAKELERRLKKKE